MCTYGRRSITEYKYTFTRCFMIQADNAGKRSNCVLLYKYFNTRRSDERLMISDIEPKDPSFFYATKSLKCIRRIF